MLYTLTNRQMTRLLKSFRKLLDACEGIEEGYEPETNEYKIAHEAAQQARRVLNDLTPELPFA